jgi:hypothetical protein
MLQFGVSTAAKSKEICVLILQGSYNIEDVRIGKILFHNDLQYFELAFQRHRFDLNPILELKVWSKYYDLCTT